jgi:hypothetical protein
MTIADEDRVDISDDNTLGLDDKI